MIRQVYMTAELATPPPTRTQSVGRYPSLLVINRSPWWLSFNQGGSPVGVVPAWHEAALLIPQGAGYVEIAPYTPADQAGPLKDFDVASVVHGVWVDPECAHEPFVRPLITAQVALAGSGPGSTSLTGIGAWLGGAADPSKLASFKPGGLTNPVLGTYPLTAPNSGQGLPIKATDDGFGASWPWVRIVQGDGSFTAVNSAGRNVVSIDQVATNFATTRINALTLTANAASSFSLPYSNQAYTWSHIYRLALKSTAVLTGELMVYITSSSDAGATTPGAVSTGGVRCWIADIPSGVTVNENLGPGLMGPAMVAAILPFPGFYINFLCAAACTLYGVVNSCVV